MTTPDQWIALGIFAAVAALVLLVAAIAASGRLGELPDAITDQFLPVMPDRALTPADLITARFATVTRGYSPAQVDRLLNMAAAQWDADRPVDVPVADE